ncbi:MAG: hypothetical protein ACOZAM_25755 [Pseudomonadota bacterium]
MTPHDHLPGQEEPPAPRPVGLLRSLIWVFLLSAVTLGGAYVFGGFTGLSSRGGAALVVGVVLSYAVGVGLMIVLFHSSRFHDERVHDAARDQFEKSKEKRD